MPSRLVRVANAMLVPMSTPSTLASARGAPVLSVTRPARLAVGPAQAAWARRRIKRPSPLRMVGSCIQVGIQHLLAVGLHAAPGRLDCHKNGVDFRQNFGILELEHPTVLFLVVHVKYTQTPRRIVPGFTLPPSLKRGAAFQIEGIKDEGLALRVKDAAKRALRLALAVYVEDIHDVETARAHEFADIQVGYPQFSLAVHRVGLPGEPVGEFTQTGLLGGKQLRIRRMPGLETSQLGGHAAQAQLAFAQLIGQVRFHNLGAGHLGAYRVKLLAGVLELLAQVAGACPRLFQIGLGPFPIGPWRFQTGSWLFRSGSWRERPFVRVLADHLDFGPDVGRALGCRRYTTRRRQGLCRQRLAAPLSQCTQIGGHRLIADAGFMQLPPEPAGYREHGNEHREARGRERE